MSQTFVPITPIGVSTIVSRVNSVAILTKNGR